LRVSLWMCSVTGGEVGASSAATTPHVAPSNINPKTARNDMALPVDCVFILMPNRMGHNLFLPALSFIEGPDQN